MEKNPVLKKFKRVNVFIKYKKYYLFVRQTETMHWKKYVKNRENINKSVLKSCFWFTDSIFRANIRKNETGNEYRFIGFCTF